MSNKNIHGVSPASIEAGEKRAADKARTLGRMPTPSGSSWNAIKSHYGLPDPKRIDSVLSEVTLPAGWKMGADPTDPYHRITIITDHEGQTVGSVFLKDTYYDRYGNISFDKKRLQELGIIPRD
jgi:hypothetical protein